MCVLCTTCFTDLAVGDSVAVMDGGFAEYGMSAAARVLPVPSPTPEMLCLLTSGLTASIALEQLANIGVGGSSAGGCVQIGYSAQRGMRAALVQCLRLGGSVGNLFQVLSRCKWIDR